MLEEFISFCVDTFPSIAPYKIENLKKAISQFDFDEKTMNYCRSTCIDYFAQGDIFDNLPFTFINSCGEQVVVHRKGMLLSNTCDSSRNNMLIFSAIQSLSEFDSTPKTLADIKNNRLTQFFYIPCTYIPDEAVDFGLINSYSREAVENAFSEDKINKICSLNDYGFYLLLTKLTIFFCRRQDIETEQNRRENINE